MRYFVNIFCISWYIYPKLTFDLKHHSIASLSLAVQGIRHQAAELHQTILGTHGTHIEIPGGGQDHIATRCLEIINSGHID